jgi:hypothetical protein
VKISPSSRGNTSQLHNAMSCVLLSNRYECVSHSAILLTRVWHGSPDKACSTSQHGRLAVIYFHVQDVGNTRKYMLTSQQEQHKYTDLFQRASKEIAKLDGHQRQSDV